MSSRKFIKDSQTCPLCDDDQNKFSFQYVSAHKLNRDSERE